MPGKSYTPSHKTATLDFIVILTIVFFTWPIIYATREAIIAPDFESNFRVIFNFVVSYFFFYAYPISILVINHISKIETKRLIINIISIVVLSYLIWKSVFMAIDKTSTDLFVSIPLFLFIWGITPTIVLVVNNSNNR